ncbi:5'/3'-nucleotidase SurE [Candidatus Korarchaeum cryptofilum]|jgi:5'-nucleotidase|uniref:5'-nucleotidase SurE n=1 Tax=Candidatus Korarchaeum cryptofilum TaxID=498846 RepID=A0A3R9PRG6_9CREN|nr:5'/3'-nucleotidase SurE [Candidatus Korarchaeum cryptofilum]RSN69617.1 5'/3'-nucleotidase SurE [Candidatus Korarchaeum cryptofilum]
MESEILLTNDDGIHSAPFRALWIALLEAKIGKVTVVVPEHEMSAAGKGITLHKPLRIRKLPVKVGGFGYREAFTVSGTPGDAVTVALKFIMNSTPDIVVSGINVGDNITLDNLFTSGTIAAALQASIMGIKSSAFSVEIPGGQLSRPVDRFLNHARIAAKITDWILRRGMPEGVDLLNVNFPYRISQDTPIRITRLARAKYENYVLERIDTRGNPYYWLGGNPVPVTEKDRGTDLYALTVERAISITPITLEMNLELLDCDEVNRKRKRALEELELLVEYLKESLSGA